MEATTPAAGADEAARRAGRPPPGRVGAWIRAKRRGEGPLVGPTSATVHAHGVARPDRGFPAGPLRTAGVDRGAPACTAEATYHPADFSIAFRRGPGDGEGGVVYLSNVFRECRGASRAERRQRILQLVSSVIAIDQVPDTWAQARGRLRPVLRAVTFGQAEATGRLTLLSRPAFPFLAELVVIDEPTAMAYVTVAQTREWGVPAVEVFEAVHANLTLLAGGSDGLAADRPPGQGPALLRFVDDGDAYYVSRLLLDGWLAGLATDVGGRPVAFVPDHNTLIVTADRPDSLGALFELVEQEYTDAVRPISPQAYTVDPYGKVTTYAAPDGHPVAAAVYRSQQEWLEAEHERDGADTFVATLTVATRPGGPTISYAVWPDGVDTLLPRAEYVSFASDHGSFFVPWQTLEREVDLVPVADLTPERYRLTAWPPPPVVERLKAQASQP